MSYYSCNTTILYHYIHNSGKLDKDDFELLTMALGYNLTPAEVSSCINDMGVTDVVPFDLFFEWWTDSMGVMAIRKRSGKK